ncbi:MAG: hypothetical protein JNL21_26320 [Myxococcales bacterium]|nr:hypothetical protein [Myxococcales bacterium]
MKTLSRRNLFRAAGGAAAGAALSGSRTAFGGRAFQAKRSVIVSIAGGLRLSESLGMAEGATMPNLFGRVPLVAGRGDADAGDPRIAPGYVAPDLVLPAARRSPLFAQGALVSNLRYAEGVPGHLQGAGCLTSGLYNDLDNREDARLAAPTLFEIHRRQTNASALDAWYVSNVAGFYRALQYSGHPEFGKDFAGSWVSPPSTANAIVPLVTRGTKQIRLDDLPVVRDTPESNRAARKLRAVLDGNTPEYAPDVLLSRPEDSAALEDYWATIYGDKTYQAFFPDAVGIGTRNANGGLDATGDGLTIYHAERILQAFKPSVMVVSLIDVDVCHDDFNGYLIGQRLADALVAHLWDFIQSTEGLKDETALFVLPEHGRQLQFNGQNSDSLGRSGLDHGGGDDGDRDVWVLALGPDFRPGVHAPTDIEQSGRGSGRYETIDVVATAAEILGHGDVMASTLGGLGARPGLVMERILR